MAFEAISGTLTVQNLITGQILTVNIDNFRTCTVQDVIQAIHQDMPGESSNTLQILANGRRAKASSFLSDYGLKPNSTVYMNNFGSGRLGSSDQDCGSDIPGGSGGSVQQDASSRHAHASGARVSVVPIPPSPAFGNPGDRNHSGTSIGGRSVSSLPGAAAAAAPGTASLDEERRHWRRSWFYNGGDQVRPVPRDAWREYDPAVSERLSRAYLDMVADGRREGLLLEFSAFGEDRQVRRGLPVPITNPRERNPATAKCGGRAGIPMVAGFDVSLWNLTTAELPVSDWFTRLHLRLRSVYIYISLYLEP